MGVGSKEVRARQYPWGVVQVENENHCDFTKLREMLIRTNMEDLCDSTHSRHYEIYTMRRESHLQSLQEREEEMRQKFVLRVKEKEAELKEAEKELHAKFDKMKQTVADEKRVVDEQRRALDEEIADFQRRKVQYGRDKM